MPTNAVPHFSPPILLRVNSVQWLIKRTGRELIFEKNQDADSKSSLRLKNRLAKVPTTSPAV
jgi:hypothetical protein